MAKKCLPLEAGETFPTDLGRMAALGSFESMRACMLGNQPIQIPIPETNQSKSDDLKQLINMQLHLYGRQNLRSGPCNNFTPVHGFMEFYPSASLPQQDVWDVSCLGGWTAGNYLGSVADVARFTYELYNTRRLGYGFVVQTVMRSVTK